MKAISYGGVTFASLNVGAGIPNDLSGPDRQPLAASRTGAGPLPMGMATGIRVIPVEFQVKPTYNIETTILALLAALDVENDEERVLVAQLNDGTTVQCNASIGTWISRPGDRKSVVVTFYATDAVWRASSATTTLPATVTFTALDGAFTPLNDGSARAYPLIKLGYTTQRTTETTTVGWKYRRLITFSNAGEEAIVNRTVFVDWGDTATLTTAKATASNLDVLVLCEGKGVNRHLICWDSLQTYIALNIDVPAAIDGVAGTRVYELVYGNPSAVSAVRGNDAMSYSSIMDENLTRSALDLQSDTGLATSGTTSVLNDTTKAFEVNRYRGGHLYLTGGTGSGQWRRIASNTATSITPTRAFTTAPDTTTTYNVWMSGWHVDGGSVSSSAALTVTDSSAAWQVNEWAGATVTILQTGDTRTVASNTATVLTVTSAWSVNPSAAHRISLAQNGIHLWYVDQSLTTAQNFAGMWRVYPRTKRPSRVFYGDELAEAWSPATRVRNNDDYAQPSYTFSTIPYGIMNSQRRRGSSLTLNEEGGGDGVAISHPLGYRAIYFDRRIQNEDRGDGTAVGKAVCDGQLAGGGDWSREVENTTIIAATTAVSPVWVDWSTQLGGAAKVMYIGGVPADDEAIPSDAKALADVKSQAYQRMEAYVDLTNLTYVFGAETAVYEISTELRIGGGSAGTDYPYDRVRIGRKAGEGHRVFIESGQELWIRTDPSDLDEPPVAIYTTGGTFVRHAPWAAVFERITTDVDGTEVALVSGEYLPLLPSSNLISNPTAETNLTGWTETGKVGTITTAWTRDAATFWDAAGSFLVTVSANTTAGVNQLATAYYSTVFPVTAGAVYELTGSLRTSNTNLEPRLAIRWLDASQVLISTSGATAWSPAVNTWYPRGESGTAPATAVYAQVSLQLYSDASGATGTVRYDGLAMGPNALWVDEDAGGTSTIAVSYTEGYLG